MRTSKKYFDDKTKRGIWNLFWFEAEKAKSKNYATDFLDRFLTENEKLMLEKRLAALYFLKQGKSLREASRKADVTKSTVIYVKHNMKRNSYKKKIYSTFPKERKFQKRRFPAYKGKGRWDFLNTP